MCRTMTTTFLSYAPTGTTEMPQSRHNAEAPRFRVKLEQWDRDYRVMAVALEINRKL